MSGFAFCSADCRLACQTQLSAFNSKPSCGTLLASVVLDELLRTTSFLDVRLRAESLLKRAFFLSFSFMFPMNCLNQVPTRVLCGLGCQAQSSLNRHCTAHTEDTDSTLCTQAVGVRGTAGAC